MHIVDHCWSCPPVDKKTIRRRVVSNESKGVDSAQCGVRARGRSLCSCRIVRRSTHLRGAIRQGARLEQGATRFEVAWRQQFREAGDVRAGGRARPGEL